MRRRAEHRAAAPPQAETMHLEARPTPQAAAAAAAMATDHHSLRLPPLRALHQQLHRNPKQGEFCSDERSDKPGVNTF